MIAWQAAIVVAALSSGSALSADSTIGAAKSEVASEGTSHALIIVGLPGDEEHLKLFTATIRHWRRWLVDRLGLDPANVHVFFGKPANGSESQCPATREAIVNGVAEVRKRLGKQDQLWVLALGHANDDGRHAWLHLPGPDLRDDELAKLFEGIECRQQVFWITTAASGRFLKGLSAKGRVVIAASTAEEDNETEFPHALAEVVQRSPEQLDMDQDGRVSVLELCRQVAAAVQARYDADRRVVTEHAQLDDNGDGMGSPLAHKSATSDGDLAAKTYLPYRTTTPRKP